MDFTSQPPQEKRPACRPGGKYKKVADELRAHPGQWAQLDGDYAIGFPYRIKNGSLKGFDPGQFEAVGRKVDGSTRYHVWARFVG